MVSIREAREDDVATVARLAQMSAVDLGGPPIDEPLEDTTARIKGIGIGRGRPIEVLIAEDRGDLVGSVFFGTLFPGDRLLPTLFVKSITVVEAHRSQGIGRLMLQSLCRMALDRGFVRIDWTAFDGNVDAIRLYHALGVELRDRTVSWRLDAEAMARMAEHGSARV